MSHLSVRNKVCLSPSELKIHFWRCAWVVAYWPLVFIVVFQLRWAAGAPESVGNHGDSHQDYSPKDQEHLYHPLSVSPSIALVQISIWETVQVPVHQSHQAGSQLFSVGSEVNE